MIEIAELTSQDTLKLPAEIAARFRPSDRVVVWAEGDALHLKRIMPPHGDESRCSGAGRRTIVPG